MASTREHMHCAAGRRQTWHAVFLSNVFSSIMRKIQHALDIPDIGEIKPELRHLYFQGIAFFCG